MSIKKLRCTLLAATTLLSLVGVLTPAGPAQAATAHTATVCSGAGHYAQLRVTGGSVGSLEVDTSPNTCRSVTIPADSGYLYANVYTFNSYQSSCPVNGGKPTGNCISWPKDPHWSGWKGFWSNGGQSVWAVGTTLSPPLFWF